MNTQQVNEMNKAQQLDELDHKIKVYDDVKGTLRLCETMIKAIDPTSDAEQSSKNALESYLSLARQWALLAVTDVEIEKRTVGK